MPAYGQVMYLTMTACVTCLVLTFMGVFIVPTLERMMEEFGISSRHTALLNNSPAMSILGLICVGVLLVIPVLKSGRLIGRKLGRSFPMMPALAERRAETLRGLADAIDAGWPMGRALATAHTIATRRDERLALEKAMQLIEQGSPAAAAIHHAGWIGAAEQAWLSDASPERTSELLRVCADQSVRDARSNLRWTMSIIFPVVILMLGVAVMTYAYGFFGSLMELIRALS